MKTFAYLLILTVAACDSPEDTTALIERAETELVLPANARALGSYDRFYAISGDKAEGIFLSSSKGKGKITIARTKKDLPFVADGGCYVVHVRLDIKTKTWERPFCNAMI
jgi:hypothetical protein